MFVKMNTGNVRKRDLGVKSVVPRGEAYGNQRFTGVLRLFENVSEGYIRRKIEIHVKTGI